MSTNRTLSAPASSSDSELKEIKMRRQRHAKIVATLGPASSDPRVIRALFNAGADVFQFNFSHGSHNEHQARYEIVREIEWETDDRFPSLRICRDQSFALDGWQMDRSISLMVNQFASMLIRRLERANAFRYRTPRFSQRLHQVCSF